MSAGPIRRSTLAALLTATAVASSLAAGPQLRDPELQLQLGDLLLRDGRPDDAVVAYRQARVEARGRDRLRAGRGLVKALLRTSEFRHARDEAEALLADAPNDAGSRTLYGDSLWAAGLFDEAESQYREAVAVDPRQAGAHRGLAKAAAARSRLDAALDAAETAVSLAPTDGDCYHTLGFVNERLRRYEDAAAAYTTFVDLLPAGDRSERAVWTRQQIRFLRSFRDREPLAMRPEVRETIHTVPFRMVRDKIVVRGILNGLHPLDLVLDTGAELTALTQRTAERYRVAPIVYTLSAGVGQAGLRGLQVGRIDRLQVGSLRVENVPTLIKNPPLRGLPIREADSFSPLAFGLSVGIDYARRQLTMARGLPPSSGDVALPLRVHRLALVRGVVNNASPVHFVVDTGGEVISISRATFDDIKTEPPRRIPLKVYGTSGWDPDAFLMPALDLAFDRLQLPKHAVVVLNLDAPSALLGFQIGGIVGHRFLSRYRVAIDLERSELRLGTL